MKSTIMKNALVKSCVAATLFGFALMAQAKDPPIVVGPNPGSGVAAGGTAPVIIGGGGGSASLIPIGSTGGFDISRIARCVFISPTITIIEHIGGEKVEVPIPNPLYAECLRGGH